MLPRYQISYGEKSKGNKTRSKSLSCKSQQKFWDMFHIFDLHMTIIPLLPLNNVGFGEKYMCYCKTLRVK